MLEWNSNCMQNLSHNAAGAIIAASRNDSKLELIVSRAANVPGNDDFLNVQRMLASDNSHIPNHLMALGEITNYSGNNTTYYPQFGNRKLLHLQTSGYGVPHSQSLVNAPLHKFSLGGNSAGTVEQNFFQRHYHNRVAQLFSDNGVSGVRAASPLILHRNFQTGYGNF